MLTTYKQNGDLYHHFLLYLYIINSLLIMKNLSTFIKESFKQDIQLLSPEELENVSSAYANGHDGKNRYNGYLCIGVLGHVNHSNDYVLFDTDDDDKKRISEYVTLKPHQFVYIMDTEKHRRHGIKSLIKIDLKTEMVYFLDSDFHSEDIHFEARGTKIRYMKALKSKFI